MSAGYKRWNQKGMILCTPFFFLLVDSVFESFFAFFGLPRRRSQCCPSLRLGMSRVDGCLRTRRLRFPESVLSGSCQTHSIEVMRR